MNSGILKNKNFILLAQGQIVSNIGNAIHNVAVTWFILDVVGYNQSGIILSLFYCCTFIPMIFLGPVSGVFVDRISRKLIIYGTDILRGFLILFLCACTYLNLFPLPLLFIVTFLGSTLYIFFNPAVTSTIPNIVDHDDLIKANSINSMSLQVSIVVGAAISGFLYKEVGIVGVYFINGISFVLSGISEMFIRIPKLEKKEVSTFHFMNDFKAGIRYVKSNKPSLAIFLFALSFSLFTQPLTCIIIPKIIKFTLKLDAEALGVFQSVSSIAAIIGMILIMKISKKGTNYFFLFGLAILSAVVVVFCYGFSILPLFKHLFSNNQIFIFYCILSFILMLTSTFFSIPIMVILQKRIPNEFRGRYFALFTTGCVAATPLGSLVFGTLSDYIIPAAIMIIIGLSLLIISILSLLSQNIRLLYHSN